MNLINPHRYGGYKCDAADFTASPYATRGGVLTNAFNSKLLTVMFWIYLDAVVGGFDQLFKIEAGSNDFDIQITSGSKVNIIGKSSAAQQLNVISNAGLGAGWNAVMASFDMSNAAKRHLYHGDTDVLNVTMYNNATINFITLATDASIGATEAGADKMDCGLADFLFWTGVYIDLSVQANRRLFYSAAGKPVDPAFPVTGLIATLGAPDVFFHLDKGETANNFVNNNDGGADGGAFTVSGSLATRATSPSD